MAVITKGKRYVQSFPRFPSTVYYPLFFVFDMNKLRATLSFQLPRQSLFLDQVVQTTLPRKDLSISRQTKTIFCIVVLGTRNLRELCSDLSLNLTLQYPRFSSNERETVHQKEHIEMLLCYSFFLRLRPLILYQPHESQTTKLTRLHGYKNCEPPLKVIIPESPLSQATISLTTLKMIPYFHLEP